LKTYLRNNIWPNVWYVLLYLVFSLLDRHSTWINQGYQVNLWLAGGVTLAFVLNLPRNRWFNIIALQILIDLLLLHQGVFWGSFITITLRACIIISTGMALYTLQEHPVTNISYSFFVKLVPIKALMIFVFCIPFVFNAFHGYYMPNIFLLWLVIGLVYLLSMLATLSVIVIWLNDIKSFKHLSYKPYNQFVVMGISLVVTILLMVSENLGQLTFNETAYILFPFLFWSAYKAHPRFYTVYLLLSIIYIYFLSLKGFGPFGVAGNHSVSFSYNQMSLSLYLLIFHFSGFLFCLITRDRDILKENIQIRETLFQDTFNHAAVGIAHVATSGKIIRVNQKMSDILGYSADDLKTKTFRDITHPDDIALDDEKLLEIVNGKISNYDIEKRYITKSGQILWGHLSVAAARRPDGKIVMFIGAVQDISAQKQMGIELNALNQDLESRVAKRTKELQEALLEKEQKQNALQQSENRLHFIFNNIAHAILYLDKE